MRRAYGNLTERILAAIAEAGPSTAADLYLEMPEVPRNHIRQALTRLSLVCRAGPHSGLRRIHIKAWVYDAEGARNNYPRPVYELGNKPNATKPKPRSATAEASKAYRAKYKAMNTRNSIFQIGVSV